MQQALDANIADTNEEALPAFITWVLGNEEMSVRPPRIVGSVIARVAAALR